MAAPSFVQPLFFVPLFLVKQKFCTPDGKDVACGRVQYRRRCCCMNVCLVLLFADKIHCHARMKNHMHNMIFRMFEKCLYVAIVRWRKSPHMYTGFFPHAFSICAWSYCCSSDKSSFLTSLHDLHACFHRTHSGGRRFFLYVRIKNKRMYQGHGSRFSNTKSVVDQSIEKSKKAILCHHNWMLFPGAAIFQYFTTQLSPYRIYIY